MERRAREEAEGSRTRGLGKEEGTEGAVSKASRRRRRTDRGRKGGSGSAGGRKRSSRREGRRAPNTSVSYWLDERLAC